MKDTSLKKIRFLISFNVLGLVFFAFVLGFTSQGKYNDVIIFQPMFLSAVGVIFLGLGIWFISLIIKNEGA